MKGGKGKKRLRKSVENLQICKTLPLFSQGLLSCFSSFKNMLFILICNVFKATIISELTRNCNKINMNITYKKCKRNPEFKLKISDLRTDYEYRLHNSLTLT